MKFGTEDLHIMPSCNGKCHTNMYSKRHSNQGRKKICSYLSHFSPTWTKFGTQDVYKNLLSDLKFRENGRNENHALLNGVDEFLSLLSTFIARFG